MARFVFILVLGLVAGGCSTFNREWRRADLPADAAGLTGRWEGTWRSEVNGHHGGLRALVRHAEGHRYDVRYRASYGKIFRFSYRGDWLVDPATNGVSRFAGQANLGIWGDYWFSGWATSTNYTSTYESKSDHGVFEMRRPSPAVQRP
jgi:hypothetical protein